MKVLIVDDDMRVREMLHEMLPSLGYECRVAANGKEALTILEDEYFPIVVSDIRMPGIDGIELLRKIKEKYSNTDVISITGHSNEYSFTDVIRAGASDFILKPFSKDELEAKIRRIIRERKLNAEVITSRNELMAIFNGIRDGMYTVDHDFKILAANKAFAESVSLAVKDIIGRQCYELVNRQDVPCEGDGHQCPAKRSFATGLPAVTIQKCLQDNGNELYQEITAMPLKGDDRKSTRVVLLSRDITSRFLGQKRLREAERKYRALVGMATEGIISTNKDGIITVFNRRAEKIFGYFPEEVIGGGIYKLLPDRYYAAIKTRYEKVAALEKTESHGLPMSIMGLKKDGCEISIELSLSALQDEQDELTFILFVKGNEQTDAA